MLRVLNQDSGHCSAQRMRLAPSEELLRLDGEHPCYSSTAEGHRKSGRLHLPASPACNIECRFCRRDFNANEHRPGVARRLVAPEEAVSIVERALALCPAIKVVGIAGPGDTLATDHALRVFRLVRERFPQLTNCLSTNGLLLPDKAEAVVAAGVKTITVTVNAVDPSILAQICAGIHYQGKRLTGEEAARILIARQLEGIARVSSLGAIVKVNSVLVPGINEGHIGEIARRVSEAGASLINIIPLLPEHELAHLPAPTHTQLETARQQAGQYINVFSHCNRCRADACGVPGETDYSIELYGEPLEAANFSHG